ncbi:MAG: D-alanyl-D-alanine carboxypeptidase family protein [Eubacteriales bacterium]|nr:D-alanyl-D-alanine carboxypeptidase family protein [Eubacteriales bacterium]
MKKIIALAMLLCLLVGAGLGEELDLYATPEPGATRAPSASDGIPELSQAPLLETPPMNLNCAAALLLEPESGQILFEMNADAARPVASVTKVMTILLTLEAIEQSRISPEQRVTISESASGMGGSQVLLDTGEVQTVEILLKSMIVGSANDASVALAELMYGSEALCVDKMNARAAELGMANTQFVNCTGLPAEGQHTSARDVARMTMAMLRHELYYRYSNIWLDEVDHGDGRVTQLTNTNKLIRLYDGCDGGKTGSTDEALYCISATARRGDMRLIAVVLGAPSGSERSEIASEMFDYGFANYRLYPVAQKGTKIKGTLPVQGGRPDSVSLILDGDLTLLVTKGSEQDISLVPELPERVEAPVAVGDLIGYVRVEQNGRTLAKLPVVAASASEIKGFDGNLKKLLRHWVLV